MERKKRKLLVTLCVIVILVVVASVVSRLVFTRDRLTRFVVPRIENAVNAKIEIGDIGIRFPFGFGVDIQDLDFNKPLAEGGNLHVASGRVIARMSLISLIRRRPEIDKVELKGTAVRIDGPRSGMSIMLRGLDAGLSVRPNDRGYSINSSVDADSVFFAGSGQDEVMTLEDIRFRGRMESDGKFDTLRLRESELDWAHFMTARLSGEVTDLKLKRAFSLRVESEENEAAPIFERLLSMPLENIPGLKGEKSFKEIPFRLSGGTFGFDSRVEGSMLKLSDMDLSGNIELKEISVENPAMELPFDLNGKIDFSRKFVGAEEIEISYGRSKADVGFGIHMSKERPVGSADFGIKLLLDLEDIASAGEIEDLSLTGKVRLDMEGSGAPAVLRGLFPSGRGDSNPESIKRAWKSVALKGKFRAEDVNLSSEDDFIELAALSAAADLSGGDIVNLKSGFSLNGSVFDCSASLRGVMPALAEMISLYGGVNPPSELGVFLDSIRNAPDISIDLSSHSLDMRPFEKPDSETGARGRKKQQGGGDDASGKAARRSLAANPLVPIVLKRTSFAARLDSVISKKAVFTGVRAEGTIIDGRLKADGILLNYAGGKGKADLGVELREPDRINTKISISVDGIEAGEALGRLHGMGNLVEGRFSIDSRGEFFSTPGVSPLATLSASGTAVSSMGRISVANLISHISKATGLDLSRYERFDFKEWTGGFVIENGRLTTDDWGIKSKQGDWSIRGSFGFDGTIDYMARLVIPPEVQKDMKDLRKYRDLAELFTDRDGNLVLSFILGGTTKSPKVSLDRSMAAEKVRDKLVDELKKRAGNLFKNK